MAAPVDRDYLRRRLDEEADRAARADSDVARAAHRRLADLYRAQLNAPAPPPYQAARAR